MSSVLGLCVPPDLCFEEWGRESHCRAGWWDTTSIVHRSALQNLGGPVAHRLLFLPRLFARHCLEHLVAGNV